jgi:hypothetical protein
LLLHCRRGRAHGRRRYVVMCGRVLGKKRLGRCFGGRR